MLKFVFMEKINFKNYPLKIKISENKQYVFDEIRKKRVLLTPEEWVRQNCIQYLIKDKKYPTSLISVEKKISINSLTKRYDIVVYKSTGELIILVECKSPKVKIGQDTFDQISRYNLALRCKYLMVTNGLSNFFCMVDFKHKQVKFINDLPHFSIIK